MQQRGVLSERAWHQSLRKPGLAARVRPLQARSADVGVTLSGLTLRPGPAQAKGGGEVAMEELHIVAEGLS